MLLVISSVALVSKRSCNDSYQTGADYCRSKGYKYYYSQYDTEQECFNADGAWLWKYCCKVKNE